MESRCHEALPVPTSDAGSTELNINVIHRNNDSSNLGIIIATPIVVILVELNSNGLWNRISAFCGTDVLLPM